MRALAIMRQFEPEQCSGRMTNWHFVKGPENVWEVGVEGIRVVVDSSLLRGRMCSHVWERPCSEHPVVIARQ